MYYDIDRFVSNKRIIFITGVGIGLTFFLLVFGYRIIDVTYVDWIWEDGSDLSLPYLGWVFYRKAEGGILSGITSLAYPHKVSIIYMDINAVVAIICKLFSDFLPDTFQYIGMTTFLQYGIQGGLTAILISKWTKRCEVITASACFSCMSTFVVYRTFVHYTLSMHWLIIAGFCVWAYREELGRLFDILWILLIPVSAMTHPYFVPILEIIFMCSIIPFLLKNRDKASWIRGGIVLLAEIFLTLAYLILFGGFESTIATADPEASYGFISEANANLNTFINSIGYSLFLPDLGNCYRWQATEGFGYLGLGIICLILIDAAVFIHRCYSRRRLQKSFYISIDSVAVIVCGITGMIGAVGYKYCWGDIELFIIPIPQFMMGVLATFRSIGRYIWLPGYLIMFGAILGFYKLTEDSPRKVATLLLAGVLFMQAIDLIPLYYSKYSHVYREKTFETCMKDEKWDKLSETHDKVVLYPSFAYPQHNYFCMIQYIDKYEMKTTDAWLAHESNVLAEEAEKRYNDLLKGIYDKDAIYWFAYEEDMKRVSGIIHCEVIDGYYVGWKD